MQFYKFENRLVRNALLDEYENNCRKFGSRIRNATRHFNDKNKEHAFCCISGLENDVGSFCVFIFDFSDLYGLKKITHARGFLRKNKAI